MFNLQAFQEHVSTVPVYRISPLRDHRWTEFIERHPRASVFHSPEWLEALRRTYGYEPVGLTTSAPGVELSNGIVFCSVQSWLTGQRMVSLPFSDHCQPLVSNDAELRCLLSALESGENGKKWKYIEVRAIDLPGKAQEYPQNAEAFCLHRLDLAPSTEQLFHSFHKNCVQRMIRRAQRDALACEEGRSEALLRKFYQLLVLTRRRQQLPPQPLAWFRNLIDCLGERLTIRVASKDGHPVASILTLNYKGTLTYKYGGSDRTFSKLGGIQLLLWKAIEEAKHRGFVEFDMGRCAWDNQGLIDFKRRWGAIRSELTYLRYPPKSLPSNVAAVGMRAARHIFTLVPDSVAVTVGRALYRHLG